MRTPSTPALWRPEGGWASYPFCEVLRPVQEEDFSADLLGVKL